MNFLRIKQISLLVVLATCTGCFRWSTITEIDSFKQASAVLDATDNQTLVVFDVDETLTSPVDHIFQHHFLKSEQGKRFLTKLNSHIEAQKDPAAYVELLYGNKMIKTLDQPIEPITVETIKKLQKRGVKVIALTDGFVGSYGRIPSGPAWRWEKLRDVGIIFGSSFPQQEIVLDILTSKSGRHPLYYKGIITTDKVSKGTCLGAFLDSVGWKPKKIIFFDDKPERVASVQDELKKRGIPFQGYIYKGTQKLTSDIDEEVLTEHLEHVKKYNEFLSDAEAHAIVQKRYIKIL